VKTEDGIPAQSSAVTSTKEEPESLTVKQTVSGNDNCYNKRPACADLDMGPWDERTVYLIVHVDDCDTTGMCQRNLDELRDMAHERFGVKDVSSSEMLGVRRTWSEDGKYLEFTMPGFIEHTMVRFKDHLRGAKRSTPFPVNEMLVRGDLGAESSRVLKRGLRELAGCLLWIWRMTMPLLGPGINQICKMMSAPDERTWDCAVWQLEYAHQHRDRGIRFCRDGNLVPHTFYDSGGTPDPTDMKAQYGHLVLVAGGPVMHTTRKHRWAPPPGSMGGEWQAAGYACKDTVYCRMLMQDVGMMGRTAPPSILTGDNKMAVGFAVEDKMTANMKHVRECFMITREWGHSGDVAAEWIGTKGNWADVVSKPVTKQVIDALGGIACGYGETVYNPANRERAEGARPRREVIDWGKIGRLDALLES